MRYGYIHFLGNPAVRLWEGFVNRHLPDVTLYILWFLLIILFTEQMLSIILFMMPLPWHPPVVGYLRHGELYCTRRRLMSSVGHCVRWPCMIPRRTNLHFLQLSYFTISTWPHFLSKTVSGLQHVFGFYFLFPRNASLFVILDMQFIVL